MLSNAPLSKIQQNTWKKLAVLTGSIVYPCISQESTICFPIQNKRVSIVLHGVCFNIVLICYSDDLCRVDVNGWFDFVLTDFVMFLHLGCEV